MWEGYWLLVVAPVTLATRPFVTANALAEHTREGSCVYVILLVITDINWHVSD